MSRPGKVLRVASSILFCPIIIIHRMQNPFQLLVIIRNIFIQAGKYGYIAGVDSNCLHQTFIKVTIRSAGFHEQLIFFITIITAIRPDVMPVAKRRGDGLW